MGDTDEVFVLKGSIKGWKEAELPTKIKKEKMPIDRQVLTISGGSVVVGVLFGSIFSSNWFFLALVTGGVLIYDGFSGKNVLKKILMELPYNKSK